MKRAIVLVSFGTTYDVKNSIDTIKQKLENKIKSLEKIKQKTVNTIEINIDIFSCYTSKIIIKILREKNNIIIKNLEETLEYLIEKNYKEVIIQPLFIVNGFEYEKLKDVIKNYEKEFNKIIVGNSLLHKDCNHLKISSSLINDNYYKLKINNDELSLKNKIEEVKNQQLQNDEAIIYMAHGSFHKEDNHYKIIEKIFQKDKKNIYIATLEGDMCILKLKEKLKRQNIRKVYLKSFMLVTGKHILKDMVSDDKTSWKSIFLEDGFLVETDIKSLGENECIQDIFVEYTLESLKENFNENNCRY